MKNISLSGWIALAVFLFNPGFAKAAYLVFGNVDGLSEEKRHEVYEALSIPRFPDLSEINQLFSKSGVQVAFVPTTAYQMIQHHLIEESRLKSETTVSGSRYVSKSQSIVQNGERQKRP